MSIQGTQSINNITFNKNNSFTRDGDFDGLSNSIYPTGESVNFGIVNNYIQGTSSGVTIISSLSSIPVLTGLSDNDIVTSLGYYSGGDGYGSDYYYRSSGRSSVTIDSGFYISGPGGDDYLEKIDKTNVTVKHFGAKGDYITDDTLAIKRAISGISFEYGPMAHGTLVGNLSSYGNKIVFPPGSYLVTDTLYYPGGTQFVGYSRGSSSIRFLPSTRKTLFQGDVNNYSRNDGWWLNSWENLMFYGDYANNASSFNSNIAIDVTDLHEFVINNCRFEGFLTGVYGDEGQSYYSVIDKTIFVDNRLHIYQGDDSAGGGIQPLTISNCSLRMSSTVTNAGTGMYPIAAIESHRPLRITNSALEGNYYYGDNAINYIGIRSDSAVSIDGLYTETLGYTLSCDRQSYIRNTTINSMPAHLSSPRLLYINNYTGTRLRPDNNTVAWFNNIKTPWSNFSYVPLITNPFTISGDIGYSSLTNCTYQTGVVPMSFTGSYQYTATNNSPLQTKVMFDISNDEIIKYRGRKITFGGLINRNGNFPTVRENGYNQRFQIQNYDGNIVQVTSEPTIGFDNGWELWVAEFDIPNDYTDVTGSDIRALWRLQADASGDICYIGGMCTWIDGFDIFPTRGMYEYWQKTYDLIN